jgi:hypothetical protein
MEWYMHRNVVIFCLLIGICLAAVYWTQHQKPDCDVVDSIVITSWDGATREFVANRIIFDTTWGGQTVVQLLYCDGTDDYVIVPEGWLIMDNQEDDYRD